MPLVSIGMPVWNCSRTLGPAIRSILRQTYPRWELLVVDDGSVDGTVDLARTFDDPRIRVLVDGRHRKISARLNEAVLASEGVYFARMDGDDIAYPQRLARQLDYLRSHPDVDVVGSSMLVFHGHYQARGKRRVPEEHDAICRDPVGGFRLAHPTFFGKLDWFRRNRYREEMSLIEDQELLLRTYTNSKFANLPEVLIGYREDRVNLKNNLVGRMMLLGCQAHHFLSARQWRSLGAAMVSQSAKAAAYAFCYGAGLMPMLLDHRAGTALSEDEIREWSVLATLVEK
jgi:glycosyltransferase involved in cell wall biosynthesis